MKIKMKTAICGLALMASLGMGMVVEAGRIPSHMVPLYTYATKRVTCYNSAGGAAQGWIDPGDYVIVSQIRSDGWAYGSYPVKNGRVSRWFKIDDLLYNPSFTTLERMSPDYKIKVYKNYSYNGEIGSVWGNEDLWVVSNLGDVWQIVYKVDSGGYKMGWVPYWDCLEKYTQWQGYAVSKTTAYTNSALTTKNGTEYVSAGDAVTVLNEQGNAYYVRYPLMKGGTKDRWVAKSAISRTKPAPVYTQWQGYASRITFMFSDANLTKRYANEFLKAGDKVTVFGESTKAYHVKYPLRSGGSRVCWVDKSFINESEPSKLIKIPLYRGTNSYTLKPNSITEGTAYSGGVYVEGFKVSKAANNQVTVSFDVYNTSHTNGVVSINNQNGVLVKQVILDPFNQGITSLKDWAHKAGGMIEGFWNLAQGNSSYLNYKNDFASTQKHIQNEKIPVGSRIVITNNFKVSPDLLLYDVVSHVVDGTSTLISIIKTCAPDSVKQKIIEETKLQLVEKLKNGARGYVLENYLKMVAAGTIKSLTKSDLKKLYEGIKKEIIANDLEAFEKLAVQNAFTKYAPAVAETVVKTMAKNLLPGFATFGIEAIFSVNKIGNYTSRILDMFYKTKAQPFTFTITP